MTKKEKNALYVKIHRRRRMGLDVTGELKTLASFRPAKKKKMGEKVRAKAEKSANAEESQRGSEVDLSWVENEIPRFSWRFRGADRDDFEQDLRCLYLRVCAQAGGSERYFRRAARNMVYERGRRDRQRPVPVENLVGVYDFSEPIEGLSAAEEAYRSGELLSAVRGRMAETGEFLSIWTVISALSQVLSVSQGEAEEIVRGAISGRH